LSPGKAKGYDCAASFVQALYAQSGSRFGGLHALPGWRIM
jgi:hypothetical protein